MLTGTGNALGDAILSAIDSTVAGNQTANQEQRVAIWRAVGAAIVNHIVMNAQVNVASVTLVSSGTDSSGPGTGSVS